MVQMDPYIPTFKIIHIHTLSLVYLPTHTRPYAHSKYNFIKVEERKSIELLWKFEAEF